MILRQLFEPTFSTYTYLIGCQRAAQAVLVDPVYDTIERDLALNQSVGLTLAYTLETHIHADHPDRRSKGEEPGGQQNCRPLDGPVELRR